MDQIRSKSLPERPRRYRFALTPLADAMFQLLIFFMLSTSLTPYSLITLRSTPDAPTESTAPGGGDGPGPAPATDGSANIAIWEVGNGTVLVDGTAFDADQLEEVAALIGSQDNPGTVVLRVTEAARVQDVATAMEALESGAVSSVQITTGAGAVLP